jgi:translation elongation factor EF-Tu-like GTPase
MKSYEEINDHELEGIIFVIPTEFGGRRGAIRSGYRGQFFWHINGVQGTDWLAEHYFENDILEPGSKGKCKIKLAGTILELGKITGMPLGRQFGLREGSRIVAVGVLTSSKYETAQPNAPADEFRS